MQTTHPNRTWPTTLVPSEQVVQLALPLVTALFMGRRTLSALFLAHTTVAAFMAHESLLVLLESRGRPFDGVAARARRNFAILCGQALLTAALGFEFAPPLARRAGLVAAALGAAVGGLALRRLEKTIAGEIIIGTTLSSCSLVVALAGGVALRPALSASIIWLLSFATAVLAARAARENAAVGRRLPYATLALGLVFVAFAAVPLARFPKRASVALLPPAALSIALCLFRSSPRRLRDLGWARVGSNVLTLALLVRLH
ncbi:MAG TPA: YwiC-like family protein [Anaeromyxobacteraceae bacterium]|nr:YwiC-like family protein [Anaeromyxobacteraceae bacterium]